MLLDHLDYQFLQVFGGQTGVTGAVTAADFLSTVSFDGNGDHIAVGDCGGRIALFERSRTLTPTQYAFLTEYQSHQAEFDYARSVDVQARVVAIRFLPAKADDELVYLTANDKDVKLWRCRCKGGTGDEKERRPKVVVRRNYSNASASSIVELLPRDDTFFIADDFGVTQWWVESAAAAHQLVDFHPIGLHDAIETLRCAALEDTRGDLLAFGTNLGTLRCVDRRLSSSFVKGRSPGIAPLFTSSRSQLEAVQFLDTHLLVARDLCFLYVLDLRATGNRTPLQPLQTLPINHALSTEKVSALQHDPASLYEAFDLAVDHRRRFVATGNFDDLVHVYNRDGTGLCFPVQRSYRRHHRPKRPFPGHAVLARPLVHAGCYDNNAFPPPESISPLRRVKHLAFHPADDLLAVTTATNLFLYGARPETDCDGYQRFDEFCAACKVGANV